MENVNNKLVSYLY